MSPEDAVPSKLRLRFSVKWHAVEGALAASPCLCNGAALLPELFAGAEGETPRLRPFPFCFSWEGGGGCQEDEGPPVLRRALVPPPSLAECWWGRCAVSQT